MPIGYIFLNNYSDNCILYNFFYKISKQWADSFNNHNPLCINVLEIFKEYRSFNTIKVIFNFIKWCCEHPDKYPFKNLSSNHTFNMILCIAKDRIVKRLYNMAGFYDLFDNLPGTMKYNFPMAMLVDDMNYYEVTEKLKNKYKKNLFENMKDTKKLYETIMASVAKQVKKAINEGEYRNDYSSREDEDLNIQGDTEQWCEIVNDYLNDHITDIQSNSDETLSLFATLVYLDQLANDEITEIAERIMEEIDQNDIYANPPVDEVFIEPVAEWLKDNASDWCADVINEWKLN